LSGQVDKKYVYQMQWQMACTERAWCDFVSFDPRLGPEMQIYVKRFERDEDAISDIASEVKQFLSEVDATVQRLIKWSQS